MRTVAEEMRAPPPIVAPTATVQEASAAMLEAGAHAAVLVESGRVRGLATVEHVSRALADGYDAAETPVATVAEPDPPLARPDEPLADAHLRMRAEGHAIVPVVGRRREPLGLLEDPEAAG